MEIKKGRNNEEAGMSILLLINLLWFMVEWMKGFFYCWHIVLRRKERNEQVIR